MTPTLFNRLLVAFTAIAFAWATGTTAAAELGCAHHGTHHGDPAAEVSHGEGEPEGQPDQPRTGQPDAGESHAGESHSHGDTGPGHIPCTCLGSCQAGSASPMEAPGTTRLAPTLAETPTQAERDTGAEPRAPTPRLLPFANGPPALPFQAR